jgi:hypothetical protein
MLNFVGRVQNVTLKELSERTRNIVRGQEMLK